MSTQHPSKKGKFEIGMVLLATMLQRFIQKGTLRVIESDGTLSEFVGSAETMFRTGAQMVFQMLLSRVREATGLTRDYMFETEQLYREQDNRKKISFPSFHQSLLKEALF